jgi:hypothetical protein
MKMVDAAGFLRKDFLHDCGTGDIDRVPADGICALLASRTQWANPCAPSTRIAHQEIRV